MLLPCDTGGKLPQTLFPAAEFCTENKAVSRAEPSGTLWKNYTVSNYCVSALLKQQMSTPLLLGESTCGSTAQCITGP